MVFSQTFLTVLIVAALAMIGISVLLLLWFLMKDVKDKKVW